MPDNRKVITQEEIDATLAKLTPPADPNNPPADPPQDPPQDNPPADPPVDNPPTDMPPVDNPPVDNPPADEPPADDPYKKKFAESSREAQILASKNRKITETVEQAASLPEPTEEELKKEYSDWDNLTEFERKMAKDTLASSRRFAMIHEAVIQNTKIDEWAKKVDEFVASPTNLQKYPDLDGREAEFRSFAMKETRRGLDFEDLVSSFLYNLENNPTPIKKGAMLNRPNGGALPTPQPTGFTPEQSALLRKTDQKKWNELVAQGKIKITI